VFAVDVLPGNLKSEIPLAAEGACARSLGRAVYHVMEKFRWRRRKGRYVYRPVRLVSVSVYTIRSAPLLANTSCAALIGAASSTTSSISLPP